jgi:hypothetical protein
VVQSARRANRQRKKTAPVKSIATAELQAKPNPLIEVGERKNGKRKKKLIQDR